MKTNEKFTVDTLKNLKQQHKHSWPRWWDKLCKVAAAVGGNTEADLSESVTVENFVAAGFTAEEGEAFMFVLAQDCMGQACTSVEGIERWFCYEI